MNGPAVFSGFFLSFLPFSSQAAVLPPQFSCPASHVQVVRFLFSLLLPLSSFLLRRDCGRVSGTLLAGNYEVPWTAFLFPPSWVGSVAVSEATKKMALRRIFIRHKAILSLSYFIILIMGLRLPPSSLGEGNLSLPKWWKSGALTIIEIMASAAVYTISCLISS